RSYGDWSSDVCSSDLRDAEEMNVRRHRVAIWTAVISIWTLAHGRLTLAQGQATPVSPQIEPPAWQYGGFLDAGYLHDFNTPSNQDRKSTRLNSSHRTI